MPSNLEKLGETFVNEVKKVTYANAVKPPEFGVIKGNLSLMPDISPGPVPKGEYSICRSVSESGGLKDGDRVLVVWYGTEPVVVDVIEQEGGG